MNLKQAIEIQEQYLNQKETHISEGLDAAMKLGIEALLYVERNRLGDVINPDALLPGETKD